MLQYRAQVGVRRPALRAKRRAAPRANRRGMRIAARYARLMDLAQAFSGALWFDVVTRRSACPSLPDRVLLHAGPPLRGAPPAPVWNATVQAVLYEGWVSDEHDAHLLCVGGGVEWQPAQDHGVVTPLAQVISPSMPLAAVRLGNAVHYGAVLEGAPPALRFGSPAAVCRDRLASLGAQLIGSVAPRLQQNPLSLAEPIRHGIAHGDDGHARTAAVNDELVRALALPHGALRDTLSSMAAFALPLLMAAASAALEERHSAVAALGGNGEEFGLRRRGETRWQRIPAAPPHGSRLPDCAAIDPLPAIGDSVVVDYCGLGGLIDAPNLRDALVDPHSGIVDVDRILSSAEAPTFNLAILDAAGARGLIGRGTYRPDLALFRRQALTPITARDSRRA